MSMLNPIFNYFVNPADPFTYKELQQLRDRQTTDSTMCHYTVKFFECDHKTEDNVKGCTAWRATGTHCDIDNPTVRKREEVSIRSENVNGLCPRCETRERALLLKEEEEERERKEREREEELLRRDLEKARLADQEEQRRNAEAHEAHLRRLQEEEEHAWRFRHSTKVSQAMNESALNAGLEASRKAYEEEMELKAAMDASLRTFLNEMGRSGDAVKEPKSHPDTDGDQPTENWHDQKWSFKAEQSQELHAELDVKVSASVRMSNFTTTRNICSTSPSNNTCAPSSTQYRVSEGSSVNLAVPAIHTYPQNSIEWGNLTIASKHPTTTMTSSALSLDICTIWVCTIYN